MIARSDSSLVIAPPPRDDGLSSAEARDRLRESGANEIARSSGAGTLAQIGRVFASPLVLLLLAASVVSASVGATVEAIIIAVIVLLGGALDALQVIRSTSAIERLRRSVSATASVLRDGEWREIPRREVVVGDTLRLVAGDLVPADAVLVSSTDLMVQQAAVTGESFPVEKRALTERTTVHLPLAASTSWAVLFGTSVASGSGIAVVVATGRKTVFGNVAAHLATAPPPTELELGLRRFGGLLTRTVVALALLLALLSIARRRDPVQSVLFAVALAVGMVPEFLPMIMSITLAAGATRMARKHTIVKHVGAIQNIGSIDILCSDKTGTLTSATMAVEHVRAAYADDDPDGRVLALAAVSAYLESGVPNPLDAAIRAAVPHAPRARKIGEIPFDFERRRVAIGAELDDRRTIIVKGAPEAVLPLCTRVTAEHESTALDDDARRAVGARMTEASRQGLRVLAVASRPLAEEPVSRESEADLELHGWLEFSDPVLPDAAATVKALAGDGVTVKILTGDDEMVSRHVCAAAGIAVDEAIHGPDIDRISDVALGAIAEKTTLFARMSPNQKLRVLLALRARGHVVGFLGDGMNDAPALHAADVGISVAGAADVARDAAEIILLDPSLATLHAGIVEGRKAFGNLMKYLLMATSSNFGNMLSMAAASLFVPFLPLLPTQILLNNFLYDVSQLAIPTDRVDDVFLRKPHHWDVPMLRRFMVRAGVISSFYDLATFAGLLGLFHATPVLFRTGWFVESLLTQTLVLLVIRTAHGPTHARPSRPLVVCITSVVVIGAVLPMTPIAPLLGFARLPIPVALFVAAATFGYLATIQLAKRRLAPEIMDTGDRSVRQRPSGIS